MGSTSRNWTVFYRRALGKVLWMALAAGHTLSPMAGAQEAEINVATTTRVTLGKTSGQPEQVAVVPIYFTAPKSVAVGRMKLQVTFISANVKFDRVEAGPLAEAANVNLSANVKLGKNESGVETSTVTLQADMPAQSADGLPAGLLAYLTLKVSATARPAQIALRAAAEAFRPGSTDPLPDVRSFDGQLEVQAPNTGPTVVCFFFTH